MTARARPSSRSSRRLRRRACRSSGARTIPSSKVSRARWSARAALAADITAWENHWLTRNLVAQNPDGVSARGRRVLDVAARVGVDGYRERLHKRALLRDSYGRLADRVDAMIAPASPGPAPLWPGDTPGQPLLPRPTGDPVFNYPSSLLGAPVVTSPLTAVRGLPMGIQLMGQPGADARMVAIARWLRDAVRPVAV